MPDAACRTSKCTTSTTTQPGLMDEARSRVGTAEAALLCLGKISPLVFLAVSFLWLRMLLFVVVCFCVSERIPSRSASVAELVDAPDLGSGGRKAVEVRVLSFASGDGDERSKPRTVSPSAWPGSSGRFRP